MNIKISIVTPTYNSAKTIDKTLNSIIYQDYHPYELIIIDNKSSDDTLNIIKSYEKLFADNNIKILLLSEPDSGIYNAMNKGIIASTGDYISILNSDDYYSNNTISKVISAISIKKCDIYYGDIIMHDFLEYKIFAPKINAKKYELDMFQPAMFVSRDFYKLIGLYDENFKLSSDYDWVIRANLANASKYKINSVLTYYYMYGNSFRNRFNGIKENFLIRFRNKISVINNLKMTIKEFINFILTFKNYKR